MKRLIAIVFLGCIITACTRIDYDNVSAMGADHLLTMVVEIPAGSNHRIRYNKESNRFENVLLNNQPQTIDFLPYPANFGFIPSTKMSSEGGEKNEPAKVFLISESLASGTLIKIIPLAVVYIDDHGNNEQIILAIPADPKYRTITSVDFEGLSLRYPGIITLMESWLMNYRGSQSISINGWGDEKEAMALVAASMITK